MLHIVELSDSDSTVSTVLECDIKPGALIQRYSVQWFQISPIRIGSISSMFNFSLSVNSSFDGNVYSVRSQLIMMATILQHTLEGDSSSAYEVIIITLYV